MGLDYRGAKECAGTEDDSKAVLESYHGSLSLNRPTGVAERKPPLQWEMGKEREHTNSIPGNGPPDKRRGNKEVTDHGPIGQQPSGPASLSVDEPQSKAAKHCEACC